MTFEKNNGFYKTSEVGVRLGVSIGTVQKLVDEGVLNAIVTQGGHRRIIANSLDDYCKKLGYADLKEYKDIYVIHGGNLVEMKNSSVSENYRIIMINHPLELLGSHGRMDSIFVDARCKWMDVNAVSCINRYSDEFQIFIYNARLKENVLLKQLKKNIVILENDISNAIIDAFIIGRNNLNRNSIN